MPQVPQRAAAAGELGPPAPLRLLQRQERLLRALRGAPRGQPPRRPQAPRLGAGARRHRHQDLPPRHRQGPLRPPPGPARHRVRQPQRRRAAPHPRRRGGLVGPGALPLAAPARPPGPPLRRDEGLGQLPAAQPEGLGAHAAPHYPRVQPGAAGAAGKRARRRPAGRQWPGGRPLPLALRGAAAPARPAPGLSRRDRGRRTACWKPRPSRAPSAARPSPLPCRGRRLLGCRAERTQLSFWAGESSAPGKLPRKQRRSAGVLL